MSACLCECLCVLCALLCIVCVYVLYAFLYELLRVHMYRMHIMGMSIFLRTIALVGVHVSVHV